jgi:hypothetical protein
MSEFQVFSLFTSGDLDQAKALNSLSEAFNAATNALPDALIACKTRRSDSKSWRIVKFAN